VEYHVFAIILALCWARIITYPIRQLYSLSYCAYRCLIGLVIIWSRLRAMNLVRSLIGSKKAFSIIAHLCSETAVFGQKLTFGLDGLIRYSTTKHAVHSYLRNLTTAHTEYVMGCTLLKLWVCKISFLKRHPSIQKGKIMKQRALLQWKEKKTPYVESTPPLNIFDWSNKERRMVQIPD
jgi:hypothetical protein